MNSELLMLITDARELLRRTALAEAKGNPLVAAFLSWQLRDADYLPLLEEAATEAASAKGADRNSRNVAVLGLACVVDSLKSRFVSDFKRQLEWLMGRPNFVSGGEPCGVVADPVSFAGVVVGAETTLTGEASLRFEQWATAVLTDACALVEEDGWRRGLLNSLHVRLTKTKLTPKGDGEPVWLAAALQRSGWRDSSDTSVSDVLKAALTGVATVSDAFEAGLRLTAIEWATFRAMDFDIAAITVSDVARILQRIPSVFQRWTWEDKPRTARQGSEPRRWHIENEYHFQSLLYTVLKPIIPALEEERYLAPTGTYQPRADLCISGLQLLVEVKFWYRAKSVKDLTEELAADLTLYLRPDSPYQKVIAAIWDDGARTEEQTELKRGLKGLNGLFDVVIVNRPSRMVDSGTAPPKAKTRRK